ncbi:hypothetical protein V6W75_07500 [Mannheimia sp. HC-2023]|uniref:hypothetical protein n=1 Tax=Mannheimia indoligenes TaxID=3103145 RepID=UPI002FE65797
MLLSVKKYRDLISIITSILLVCIGYKTYTVYLNQQEPYFLFVTHIKEVSEGNYEFSINIGNYGEGVGIIDEFELSIKDKKYISGNSFLWNQIFLDNGIPIACIQRQSWLSAGYALSAKDEEKFLSIKFNEMDADKIKMCLKPFLSLLKEGHINYILKYHSIHSVNRTAIGEIKQDFSIWED